MLKASSKIEMMFASEQGCKLYNKILSTLCDTGMDEKIASGVLVGLSGGADSIFLLSFLFEYRRRTKKVFQILSVHINHSIRADEATRDEEFSNAFSLSLGIPFESYTVDIPKISNLLGLGIEETARNQRYSIFSDIIRGRDDISTIATAHNATDNAETVIMNIMRGCGLQGASGIKPIRDSIIRPIITLSKNEIRDILDEFSIKYMVDSTNLSSEYTRNYVRNEIMPLMSRLTPSPETSLTRMTESLRRDNDFIESVADNFIIKRCEGKIKAEELRALHPAIFSRVLSHLIFKHTSYFPEEKHISAISALIKKDNFRYSLTGDSDFACERGICFFCDKYSENRLNEQIFSLVHGENKINGTNLSVYVGADDKTSSNVYNFSIQVQISSAIINDGRLQLRFKSDGDSYVYSGMTHKLKKVFNDRNIPKSERSNIPILCDSKGILVVPGLPVRDGAKSGASNENTTITFAYSKPTDGEIEVFTALLRK